MSVTSQQSLSPEEAARWTQVGLLAALALLLSYVETFVPIPIPGVKLGLANIPVLVALAAGDVSGAASIALIKVLATGLLFGSPLTLAYSLAGTMLSLAGMMPLSRLRTLRLWMLSIVGALLHEAGQLAVASVVLGTSAIWHATPLLIVAGCMTGGLCGTLAGRLLRALPQDPPAAEAHVAEPKGPSTLTRVLFVLLVTFVIVVLRVTSLVGLAAATAVLALARPRAFARAVRPTLAAFAFTFVMQLLVAPNDALALSGRAALRLACIATASMAFAQAAATDEVASTVAWLVLPLTRRGVRTQGFVLAVDVAVRLVPRVSALVRDELVSRNGHLRLRDLPDLLPSLVRRLY